MVSFYRFKSEEGKKAFGKKKKEKKDDDDRSRVSFLLKTSKKTIKEGRSKQANKFLFDSFR